MSRRITRIETVEFKHQLADVANHGEGVLVHNPASTYERTEHALRIVTADGLTGEYVGGNSPAYAQIDMVAETLVGKNALKRERHWSNLKRILRKYDRMGIGPIDIALWDLAGKAHEAPIHELLGTYRERLPAYASTYFGSETGLDSPEAYAEFADRCADLGYPAFKIHPITGLEAQSVQQDIATVRAVDERVGDEMHLMLDPVSSYETFADALEVGKACDEHDYFWYEDPYRDGGRSQHAHRKLREFLETPLLQTELLRGFEPHTDFIATDGTDFVRADPEWDGGITGAMKIARVAEGFGLDVEFHLAGPAQRHCMAAARNSNFYEIGLVHPQSGPPHAEPPIYTNGYTDRLEAIDSDGTFSIPDGAGLGVSYDWDYIHETAVDQTNYE